MKLSVVPIYKEKNVPPFLGWLHPILAALPLEAYEILFALGPSTDHTEEIILEHRALDERVKLLKCSRRYS